jgi:DNA-binding GntR family transcriptional regulator
LTWDLLHPHNAREWIVYNLCRETPLPGLEENATPRARPLADQVYPALVEAIVTGELAAGSRVIEVELARRYGVSRGPLREAIQRLEKQRLVTRTAHVGARIAELSNKVLLEIFLVREALEGMAARLAAERMSVVELDELGRLLESHDTQMIGNLAYYQRASDWDFHYRLIKGARNSLVEDFLCGDLYHLIRFYRYQHRSSPGRGRRALVEHRRILDALRDRDGDLAEILMRRHIATARKVLEASIATAHSGPDLKVVG